MERSNKIESGGWPGHRNERRAVTVAFRASPFAASANRSTAQSPGRSPVLDEQISSEGISAKSKLCHGCKTFLSSQLERAWMCINPSPPCLKTCVPGAGSINGSIGWARCCTPTPKYLGLLPFWLVVGELRPKWSNGVLGSTMTTDPVLLTQWQPTTDPRPFGPWSNG